MPDSRGFLDRVVTAVARRPLAFLIGGFVLVLASGLIALTLQPNTGVETLVGDSSQPYKDTQRYAKEFGSDPIVIMAKSDQLAKIVLGPDIGRMLGLEGCLSGNAPVQELRSAALPQPCKRLAELKPATVVYGPGTFVNTAANSVLKQYQGEIIGSEKAGKRAANAARQLAIAKGLPPDQQEALAKQAEQLKQFERLRDLVVLGDNYGLTLNSPPAIDNQDFVARLIFDINGKAGTPKSRFGYLFPDDKTALILMRLRPDLTAAQRAETIDLVRQATGESKFKLDNAKYAITGAPILIDGLERSVTSSLVWLLLAALLVMAAVLMFVFPVELRLLPLFLALAATGLTFGALAVAGAGLTIAAIAVVPVLIGLAVDYAIQLQWRVDAQIQDGQNPADAVQSVGRFGLRTVLAAAASTVAGLLMLLLSPVPLVRSFGLLLVIGIAFALIASVTMGLGALVWAGGSEKRSIRKPAFVVARKLRLRQGIGWALAHPERAMVTALIAATLGWAADTQTKYETDITKLAPAGLQELKDIEALQKSSGVSGEVDVVVRGKNVTSPAALTWMREYQQRVLAANGYKGEQPSCKKALLCPEAALTDLFRGQQLTKRNIKNLLNYVDPYFSRAILTKDKKTANLAFGVRLGSLEKQGEVIKSMRDNLDPPKGFTAQVVGLPVLAADANTRLGSPLRRFATLALALVAIFLVVLLLLKSIRQAFTVIVTVALASGWSSLLVFVLRVPVNPLSAALSVFVVAIAAEFAVLLYRSYISVAAEIESESGTTLKSSTELFGKAYRQAGPAIFASGATAIAGFAVLATTSIAMLRGFALVAVIDLVVSLAGVALLLPASVRFFERRSEAAQAASTRAQTAATST